MLQCTFLGLKYRHCETLEEMLTNYFEVPIFVGLKICWQWEVCSSLDPPVRSPCAEATEADSERGTSMSARAAGCWQQQMASWSRSEAFADPDFIKPQVADATRVFQSCSQNFRPNFSFRKDDYRARQRWLNGNGRGKADRHCYMENGKR